jgi:hypothetical protein
VELTGEPVVTSTTAAAVELESAGLVAPEDSLLEEDIEEAERARGGDTVQ